jgi:hypothetical protein
MTDLPEWLQDKSEQTQNNYPEWTGMPEFVQEKKKPYKELIVRFDDEAAYLEFQKLIDQDLTIKTKSIWHPFKSHWGLTRKVYVNES